MQIEIEIDIFYSSNCWIYILVLNKRPVQLSRISSVRAFSNYGEYAAFTDHYFLDDTHTIIGSNLSDTQISASLR